MTEEIRKSFEYTINDWSKTLEYSVRLVKTDCEKFTETRVNLFNNALELLKKHLEERCRWFSRWIDLKFKVGHYFMAYDWGSVRTIDIIIKNRKTNKVIFHYHVKAYIDSGYVDGCEGMEIIKLTCYTEVKRIH